MATVPEAMFTLFQVHGCKALFALFCQCDCVMFAPGHKAKLDGSLSILGKPESLRNLKMFAWPCQCLTLDSWTGFSRVMQRNQSYPEKIATSDRAGTGVDIPKITRLTRQSCSLGLWLGCCGCFTLP